MQRDLVERARNGDHDAFEALASPLVDRLYAVARRILRDAERSEDAVQECLLRAWRDLRGLHDPERFEAWVYRMLVNACRDEARRVRRRPIEVRVTAIEHADEQDSAAALADRDALERGFARLSVDQRSVLVLHYYVGLPAPEIAEDLGISVGTVYSRLHYATAALRAVLEADARPGLVVKGGRPA